MPISEKKKASNAKWDRENMATLGCRVRREEAEEVKTHAEGRGETVNGFLKRAIEETMARDKTTPPVGDMGTATPAG